MTARRAFFKVNLALAKLAECRMVCAGKVTLIYISAAVKTETDYLYVVFSRNIKSSLAQRLTASFRVSAL